MNKFVVDVLDPIADSMDSEAILEKWQGKSARETIAETICRNMY